MTRAATGTLVWRKNAATGAEEWHVRVRLPDGTRPFVPLPGIARADRHVAREAGAIVSKELRGRAPVDVALTVRAYADRWIKSRQHLAYAVEQERHLEHHILPVIGDRPIGGVTRDELRKLVARLDERVRDGELAWATAKHIWGTVTRLFGDAANHKRDELRVRPDDNPVAGLPGPDTGDEKALQFLFPHEAVRFLACEDVPLAWRRTVAIACYTGLRAGELAALRWEDVDLKTRTMLVHRSEDRVRNPGKVGSTKSGVATRVPLEPAIVPLLEAMRGAPNDPVVWMPSVSEQARGFRKWLAKAGVERADLYASDATRRPIRFHDTRSTFATWLAARGEPTLMIKAKCRHASVDMTEKYVRVVALLGSGFGHPFPELPGALAPLATPLAKTEAKSAETLWAQQDLNL